MTTYTPPPVNTPVRFPRGYKDIPAGMTGTVSLVDDDSVRIKMDFPVPDLLGNGYSFPIAGLQRVTEMVGLLLPFEVLSPIEHMQAKDALEAEYVAAIVEADKLVKALGREIYEAQQVARLATNAPDTFAMSRMFQCGENPDRMVEALIAFRDRLNERIAEFGKATGPIYLLDDEDVFTDLDDFIETNGDFLTKGLVENLRALAPGKGIILANVGADVRFDVRRLA